jgi:hypothetical protein
MPLNLENLNDENVRTLMMEEFEKDLTEGKCYYSNRLKPDCHEKYAELMKDAIRTGDDSSLSEAIRAGNILETMVPRRKPTGGMTMVNVPVDAHVTLAEGEFNRCYLRGICRKAVDTGARIEVYRAKQVREPRPESQAMIGRQLDPNQLLSDLRANIGFETHLKLPPGPNSGLSGRFA